MTGEHVMRFRVDAQELHAQHCEEVVAWLAGLGFTRVRAIAVFETDGRCLLHVNSLRQVDGRSVLDWAVGDVVTESAVVEIDQWPELLDGYAPEQGKWMAPGAVHIPVTRRVEVDA